MSEANAAATATPAASVGGAPVGSEQELEAARQRSGAASRLGAGHAAGRQLPENIQDDLARAGPLEAIKLYDRLLEKYPSHEHNDQVLYQKARAYDELGRTVEAMKVMEQLIAAYPNSKYLDEVHFRRAEHFFTRKKFRDAEGSYQAIIKMGPVSEYYELALYKLGWSLYKQEAYDEALDQYVALLDYKVSIGYDFDGKHEEGDERRIADTFDIISLSFSNLGGPEAVQQYFAGKGKRGYEDRVYRNLGEYYLTKLRYHDAAKSYNTFVAQYPLHKRSPHFSMRVIEIYETGRFPQLVLDSKKAFASDYGLSAEYWRHFDVQQSPEVLSYLKSNLRDLANHYHAQYQDKSAAENKVANYTEAARWYGQYIASFQHRCRDAGDQLSARGPAAREQGLRRRGARIRAHRVRIREARPCCCGGLRRGLRASRAPEGRRRGHQARRAARYGGELAALRRHVPRARARCRRFWAQQPTICTT